MDEILKRRLVGAAALLLGALLLASLVPDPGTAPALEAGQKRVIIDLGKVPQAVTVVTAAEPAAESEAETPAETPAEIAPESVAEALPAAAEPVVPEPAPAEPVRTSPAAKAATPAPAPVRPTLKLDSALTQLPESTRPKPQAAAPASATAPKPVTTAPAARPWYVQAGSFGEVSNARQLLEKLKPQGYAGLISPAETAGGTRYRVRLGPYAERPQAEAARTRLTGAGISGTSVIQD